jgi:hypothetical protein
MEVMVRLGSTQRIILAAAVVVLEFLLAELQVLED